MKALFSSLMMLMLTTAAYAESKPGEALEDYYRFYKQENLAAYYDVMDIRSMGPRELKSRQSLTRTLWQRFDTLDYQIEDLRLEQDDATAIASYRLKATISGPDDSGRTAKLETDQKQVALLVLRSTDWKVALVSDEVSFYTNLQNIFLQRQLRSLLKTEKPVRMTAENSAAADEARPPASTRVTSSVSSDGRSTKSDPRPTLATIKDVYESGEKIIVKFDGINRPANQDWVSLYKKGASNKHYGQYFYLKTQPRGKLTFTAPSQEGTYEFRLFLNWPAGGYNDVARSQPIVVGKSSAGTSLQLDKELYQPSEKILVTFTASASFADVAWIGVIPSTVPHGSEAENDKHDLSYQYLKKRTAGRLTFSAPASPGNYDMRMHDTDSNGAEVASITFRVTEPGSEITTSSTASTAQTYRLVAKWGGKGKEDGKFRTPIDITVDGDNHVYVCDMSDRIQKFTADGKFLKAYAGQLVKGKDGKFNRPFGLTVDDDNNLYVSDYSYNQIHKFSSEFMFLLRWPKMEYNFGIAADAAGNIYVAEKRDNRLRKFDPNGKQLEILGADGNGTGQLVDPIDVALDRDGNIFVVEQKKCRIQKFDPQGKPLVQWGKAGPKPGQFNRPNYLTVDRAGYVYVSDTGNRRVQKFDNNGNFVCQFGKTGSNAELVGEPVGIAVDVAGNIYVADRQNHQVKKYAPVN